MPFTEEIDRVIVNFIDEAPRRPRKWLALHDLLQAFPAQALRYRYSQLKLEAKNAEWAAVRADFILENPDVVEVFAEDGEIAGGDEDEGEEGDGDQLRFGELPIAIPPRPLTGYLGFCKENQDAVVHLAGAARVKELGRRWRSLSDEEKARYQAARRPALPSGKKSRGRPMKKLETNLNPR